MFTNRYVVLTRQAGRAQEGPPGQGPRTSSASYSRSEIFTLVRRLPECQIPFRFLGCVESGSFLARWQRLCSTRSFEQDLYEGNSVSPAHAATQTRLRCTPLISNTASVSGCARAPLGSTGSKSAGPMFHEAEENSGTKISPSLTEKPPTQGGAGSVKERTRRSAPLRTICNMFV